MLNVTRIAVSNNNENRPFYPFMFRIGHRLNEKELTKWAKETNFYCMISCSSVYVVDEKDIAWFLLRWS